MLKYYEPFENSGHRAMARGTEDYSLSVLYNFCFKDLQMYSVIECLANKVHLRFEGFD